MRFKREGNRTENDNFATDSFDFSFYGLAGGFAGADLKLHFDSLFEKFGSVDPTDGAVAAVNCVFLLQFGEHNASNRGVLCDCGNAHVHRTVLDFSGAKSINMQIVRSAASAGRSK